MSKTNSLTVRPLKPLLGLYREITIGAEAQDGAVRLVIAAGPMDAATLLTVTEARALAALLMRASFVADGS